MQRTGRKGHAMFRVVVQDSRVTPTSGKVIAYLGSYDPHAKTASIDVEKATTFLSNGAQPSDRAALLLEREGVKLPAWYKKPAQKTGILRNPDKLRKNQPEQAAPEVEVAPEAATEEQIVETEEVAA